MNKAAVFLFALLFAARLSAQTAENDSLIAAQTISLKLGTLLNNQSEFFSKESGAEIPFTVTFKHQLKSDTYYSFDYELYTADGTTLVCKSQQDERGTQSVRAEVSFQPKAVPVVEEKFFVFYKHLQNYTGKQKFNLRIFAKHKKREHGEVFRADVYITTPKIEIVSADKQSFILKSPKFTPNDEDFWDKKRCISFSGIVTPKYDKNSLLSIEQYGNIQYTFYALWRDKSDSIVFDSRRASHKMNQTESFYAEAPAVAEDIKFHCQYDNFAVRGKQVLRFELRSQFAGIDTLVYRSAAQTLSLPSCKNSSEYKAVVSGFSARTDINKGAISLLVKAEHQINLPISHLCSNENLRLVMSIHSADGKLLKQTQIAEGKWLSSDYAQNFETSLPLAYLDLSSGTQKIKISFHLNEQPPSFSKEITINMPECPIATLSHTGVEISSLTTYDPIIDRNLSKGRADVYTCLYYGSEYTSGKVSNNSYTGLPFSHTFRFCKGDEITLYIYDSDLNRDDKIGSYLIRHDKTEGFERPALSFENVTKLDLKLEFK